MASVACGPIAENAIDEPAQHHSRARLDEDARARLVEALDLLDEAQWLGDMARQQRLDFAGLARIGAAVVLLSTGSFGAGRRSSTSSAARRACAGAIAAQ